MLWIDFETFNTRERDLKIVGTYEYARTCRVLLTAYAFDDGPVQLWDATKDPMPDDLREASEDPSTKFYAHNSMFDRNVAKEALGWTHPIENWHCTMVDAMLHGFPGALDALCSIFKLSDDQAKIKDGKKLIQRFCKPPPASRKAKLYDRGTHPDEWARFCEYAINDIVSMRAISKKMPTWNADEAGHNLDQRINDRGFAVDTQLVKAGEIAAREEKADLFAEFARLTHGELDRPTKRDKFQQLLTDKFGIEIENTQAATLALEMEKDIEPDARRLLEIAVASNKTSTAKYGKLGPATSPDQRFRGGLQFSGATRTRRWAGRTFQPQNLPSRGLPKGPLISLYIDALKAGSHSFLFDELMLYGSAALRGVLIAPKNRKLIATDLANIEGRANAYLAGELTKLKAFIAFDAGEGPDVYNVTAGSIIGKTPDQVCPEKERNVFGKIPELSLGYQGGVGAIRKFCDSYGISMTDFWDAICASVEKWCVVKARANYFEWGKKLAGEGVTEAEWIACETIKLSWRNNNPNIVQLWYDSDKAAKSAIASPGQVFTAGKHLRFRYLKSFDKRYLVVRLPSGKCLQYAEPYIHRAKKDASEEERENDGGIMYWGKHPTTGRWARLNLYGGKIIENACQSLSRDILMENMIEADAAGYEIVLTVHDEIVCEVPDSLEFTEKHLSEILAQQPEWAKGFPLAAKGFEAYRYRK